ncbi:MAG: hypothetical protein J0M36_08045 [Caulobacterales bacterium]|jgi:hypothetical protein|nr:hypothetical protein [Caulobacterales bacterium]
MMEVMRDLEVRGTRAEIDALVDHMTCAAEAPWARSAEGEANIGDESYRVFSREADGSLPALGVALHLEPEGIQIVNIVPRDVGNLGTTIYNAALQEFLEQLIQPAAAALSLSVVTSLPRTSLAAEVGPEIARLLVQFSGAANQSSGSSHPADFRRWATFLATVHRSGKRLDTDLLYATLREQGWPKEKASDLVSEFEFARELLKVADDVS